jgi:hypothetical protein
MLRSLLSFLLMMLLAGCGGSDPSFVRLGDYENDAGEAAVRFVIQHLPEFGKGVPKEYCVVKALDLRSTDTDFIKRFVDLKLPFVSADVLSEQEETHFPINPKSGLTPVMVQIAHMKKLGADHYEVEIGWSWKKSYERKRFDVLKDAGAWKVTELERLDSSIVP